MNHYVVESESESGGTSVRTFTDEWQALSHRNHMTKEAIRLGLDIHYRVVRVWPERRELIG